MCYESPGPRCYNDSNKKLIRLTAKLDLTAKEIKQAEKLLSEHASKNNYNGYEKVRRTLNSLKARHESLETEVRYVQRDLDSTKTGMKKLEQEIAQATTKSAIKKLDDRRRAAKGLRYQREHALELKKSGATPVINFTVPQAA
jgi:chromosome segregation ATPase